jgi:hypothetical protein
MNRRWTRMDAKIQSFMENLPLILRVKLANAATI